MEFIGNQQLNSAHAAFEVGANRCDVNHERITWSRSNTENRATPHQQRSYIHCTSAHWWQPIDVGLNDLFNRIDENGFWNWRHLQSIRTTLHTSSILIRTEEDNTVLVGSIGFHSFKQTLSIVENTCCRRDGNVAIGTKISGHPWFVTRRFSNVHGIGWCQRKGKFVPVDIFAHNLNP